MDKRLKQKLQPILNTNFNELNSLAASKAITKMLDLINALEWTSSQVNQNIYDDLNNRYSDAATINERLQLIANTFDNDAFLLSIIDQLRDRVNDDDNQAKLYAITLDNNKNPLNDTEIENRVKQHGITLRAVSGRDAEQVVNQFKTLLKQVEHK